MPHPLDSEIIPIGTKVLFIGGFNKGKKGVIVGHNFKFRGADFLSYEVTVEGRQGKFNAVHDDVKVID